MPSLLSSNIGDGDGDWSCLCSAFSPCSITFSNTVGMAAISRYNKIRNYYWIDTVFSLSIYLISIFQISIVSLQYLHLLFELNLENVIEPY